MHDRHHIENRLPTLYQRVMPRYISVNVCRLHTNGCHQNVRPYHRTCYSRHCLYTFRVKYACTCMAFRSTDSSNFPRRTRQRSAPVARHTSFVINVTLTLESFVEHPGPRRRIPSRALPSSASKQLLGDSFVSSDFLTRRPHSVSLCTIFPGMLC